MTGSIFFFCHVSHTFHASPWTTSFLITNNPVSTNQSVATEMAWQAPWTSINFLKVLQELFVTMGTPVSYPVCGASCTRSHSMTFTTTPMYPLYRWRDRGSEGLSTLLMASRLEAGAYGGMAPPHHAAGGRDWGPHVTDVVQILMQ